MIRVQRSGLDLRMAPRRVHFKRSTRLLGNTLPKPTINSRLQLPYHVMDLAILPPIHLSPMIMIMIMLMLMSWYRLATARREQSIAPSGAGRLLTYQTIRPVLCLSSQSVSQSVSHACLHYSGTLPSLDGGMPSVCCLMSSLHASAGLISSFASFFGIRHTYTGDSVSFRRLTLGESAR
jgi:hypothetical protein